MMPAPAEVLGKPPTKAPVVGRRKPNPLIVDARMLFSSGIGRYLREILARKPEGPPGDLHFVCNCRAQEDWIRENFPAASLVHSRAGIYSLREQWQAHSFAPNATYWIPHYNVPWRVPCHLIATVHDLAPLALPEAFGGLLRRLAARFYFRCVRHSARQIITVSKFTQSELLARRLAPEGRISVIHNGVGSYWFEGSSAGERGRRLLYVGNLKPHKNLERLVDAVTLARRHRPFELVVAGRFEGFRTGLAGPLLDRLRSTPWIRLLGETSDSDLRKQYREAGALVFPSLYEGFGLPVLEAMAAGCPVVCSRIPAIQEIAGPGRESGGVVDYFDPASAEDMAGAILRRVEVPTPEQGRLGQEGRRLAGGYSWDKTAKATWTLLQERSFS